MSLRLQLLMTHELLCTLQLCWLPKLFQSATKSAAACGLTAEMVMIASILTFEPKAAAGSIQPAPIAQSPALAGRAEPASLSKEGLDFVLVWAMDYIYPKTSKYFWYRQGKVRSSRSKSLNSLILLAASSVAASGDLSRSRGH